MCRRNSSKALMNYLIIQMMRFIVFNLKEKPIYIYRLLLACGFFSLSLSGPYDDSWLKVHILTSIYIYIYFKTKSESVWIFTFFVFSNGTKIIFLFNLLFNYMFLFISLLMFCISVLDMLLL